MQVLHYDPAQKYDAHHDWGVDAPTGKLVYIYMPT
jgi:hypothetical protein